MILIYQAQNSPEAHLILNLLEQAGLTARIDGEYLQGGMGELQIFGNVRVLIDEADYEQGKEIIKQWESHKPLNIKTNPNAKHYENKPHSSFLTIKWGYFSIITIVCLSISLMLYAYSNPIIDANCFSGPKPFHVSKTYKTTIIPVIEEVHSSLSFEDSNNNNLKDIYLVQGGPLDDNEIFIDLVMNEELEKLNTQNLYKSINEKIKSPINQ